MVVPARGVVLVLVAWVERGEGTGSPLFLTGALNTTWCSCTKRQHRSKSLEVVFKTLATIGIT